MPCFFIGTSFTVRGNSMKKRLLPTLLIIIFVLASITPFGKTLSAEQNNLASSTYDRTYTLDAEHGNHRSTCTMYLSVPPSLYGYYRGKTVGCEVTEQPVITPDYPVCTVGNQGLKLCQPSIT